VLKTLSENQVSLTDTVSTIANMTAKQPAVPNVVSAISDQPSSLPVKLLHTGFSTCLEVKMT